MENKRTTITLTDANAWQAKIVSAILGKSVAEVVSSCLKGSTNPDANSNSKAF